MPTDEQMDELTRLSEDLKGATMMGKAAIAEALLNLILCVQIDMGAELKRLKGRIDEKTG